MDKKRILFFSQNYYPSSLADAVRVDPIIDYLKDRGFDIHLLTQTKDCDKQVDNSFKIELLKWTTPNNGDKNLVRLLKEIGLGIELFVKVLYLGKFDYYFFTSPPFISCSIGAFAAFLKGGKVLFDVRDIYPDIYVKQGLIKKGGKIHNALVKIEQFIYNKSYCVLAATEGLYQNIRSNTTTRCILFRNGFSKKFFPSHEKEDYFTVVFHGNLGRFQNIELLVDLINCLNILAPNIKFIAIGSGPKEVLLSENRTPNFRFLGRLSNDETSRIVNRCHVGVSLRDDSQISVDAFPVKIYEYIGSSIPAIVTPICEGGKVLTELKIGFNIENDKERIVQLILELSSDEKLYNRLVSRLMEERGRFSREKVVESVFNKVL